MKEAVLVKVLVLSYCSVWNVAIFGRKVIGLLGLWIIAEGVASLGFLRGRRFFFRVNAIAVIIAISGCCVLDGFMTSMLDLHVDGRVYKGYYLNTQIFTDRRLVEWETQTQQFFQ